LKSSRFIPFAALAIFLIFVLTGCRSHQSTSDNGLTPVRLQLDWYPQPEHGGFFTAQMLGYYRAEGLDVTILPLPQYGSVAPLVSTGAADFGLGSSDQIIEWNSNGLPLLAVAATMQHDPQAIMVHKDSPVRDFKDLEGHTVAAQTGAVWLTTKVRTLPAAPAPVTVILAWREVGTTLADALQPIVPDAVPVPFWAPDAKVSHEGESVL